MSPRWNDVCWTVFFTAISITLAFLTTHWLQLVAAGAGGATVVYLLVRITTTPKEHHEYHARPDHDRRRHR